MDAGFRRSNCLMAKPPKKKRYPPFPCPHYRRAGRPLNRKKTAFFSDANPLPSIHRYGTLASASPATRPQGSDVPPESQPAPPKYTATATHRTASQVQRQRHREKNRAITKQPGSGQHGQNRRYCNHRRIRHALRSIPRGCVRPRRGRSHRSMPVQQWAGAWKTRTRNLASKIALAVAPTA